MTAKRNHEAHAKHPINAEKKDTTRKFAKRYATAAKKVKGQLLGGVSAITDWSRDSARTPPGQAVKPSRVVGKGWPACAWGRAPYDAWEEFQQVYSLNGGIDGKHLAASLEVRLML